MTYSYSYQVGSVRLLGLARLLGIWKASVYKLVFREVIIFCVFYSLISAIYRFLLIKPSHKLIFEKVVVYCSNFESVLPLTFILGFYVTLVAQRWWSQFINIPWPDRFMSYIATMVGGIDEESIMLRRTLVRYLILAEVLLLQAISPTVKKRFPNVECLVTQGLMTHEEFELYNCEKVPHISSKYWLPTQWCAMLLKKARDDRKIRDSMIFMTLMNELSSYKSTLGNLFSYDWISIPLVYTQVATISVYIFYFNSMISRQFLNFESVKATFGPDLASRYAVDLYIPYFTLIQIFFYIGWLKVAEQMINPFGEDDDDFECNWIIDRNLKVGLYAVDGMMSQLPPLRKDKWWSSPDPQLYYTIASEKFAMTNGWFGSTMNLQVTGAEAQHVTHMPDIAEADDIPESSFTSTQTLGGVHPDNVSPKKNMRRLPPLLYSIDHLDEIKKSLSQRFHHGRSQSSNQRNANVGSPQHYHLSRSMPAGQFCVACNVPASDELNNKHNLELGLDNNSIGSAANFSSTGKPLDSPTKRALIDIDECQTDNYESNHDEMENNDDTLTTPLLLDLRFDSTNIEPIAEESSSENVNSEEIPQNGDNDETTKDNNDDSEDQSSKRVAFNLEIEQLEYYAHQPVDNLVPEVSRDVNTDNFEGSTTETNETSTCSM